MRKLELTQGIDVPSNGKSGELAMIWKEGTDIRFKSCSNSHINMVVYDEKGLNPCRATWVLWASRCQENEYFMEFA